MKTAAWIEGRGTNAPSRVDTAPHSSLVTKATATQELPPRLKKPAPIIMNGQVLHSITEERLDVIHSISDHVAKNVSGSELISVAG